MITPTYIYRATCRRVVDGDTFIARIDLGFHVEAQISVRLHGVDTPERGHPQWAAAGDFLRRLVGEEASELHIPQPLVIQTYRDRMSFNRWIADVYKAEAPGTNVAEAIINSGLGVPMS